jgi:Flp pilus assembly pilin Flp
MYRRRIRESLLRARGQALVEYALILTLVVMAMAVALAATGPAISNIFSNTVYNLIGLSGTPLQTIQNKGGGSSSFWQTVTAVAANPQGEVPFPTNPPAPPTASPTAGPSPTPTQITPSPTPSNTPTLPPSATPTDYALVAPFYDTVDTPERWRLDSSVWIGSDEWKGEYFPNETWTGTPDFTLWNGQIDTTYKWNINFDWGTGGPITTPAWLSDNFSIRYTRQIYVGPPIPGNLPVRFTTSADGQVRLRIQLNQTGAPVDIPGLGLSSGASAVYTIPPGLHNLILEYSENTSNPAVVSTRLIRGCLLVRPRSAVGVAWIPIMQIPERSSGTQIQ